MEEFTLEQLRAVLETRKLRQLLGEEGLSSPTPRSRDSGVGIRSDAPGTFSAETESLGDLPPVEDLLANVSSASIVREMRARQKAVYGDDDRVEVVEATDVERRRRARSVAAVIERDDLVALDDGRVSIGGVTLGDSYAARGKPLCRREAFREQPSSAVGTAFLVAPTLVATAHHCLNEDTIATRCLVFDFETDATGAAATSFRVDQIYGVRRFVAGVYTDDGEEWAVVELDREVADREPLTLRLTGTATDYLPLYVIGHPSGLPKKIAGKAEVRVNTASTHFLANLDTYGGNSGSPVFNALTHEVEGILIRGETDFVPLGDCYASLVCPLTGCRGEHCSRIEPVARILENFGDAPPWSTE